MKEGNWIPMDKALIKYLPKNRPYTVLEAYFSLRCDIDEGKHYTVNGYSQLWQWDRKKVRNFVKGMLSGNHVEMGHIKETRGKGKGNIVATKIRLIASPLSPHFFPTFSPLFPHQKSNDNNDVEGQKDSISPLIPHLFPTYFPTTIKTNTNTNNKKHISPESLRLSGVLADWILKNNPSHKDLSNGKRDAIINRWGIDIDRMLRIDKRNPTDIEAVINWCQQDPFWLQNILSGATLRKQYDKLILKVNRVECVDDRFKDW